MTTRTVDSMRSRDISVGTKLGVFSNMEGKWFAAEVISTSDIRGKVLVQFRFDGDWFRKLVWPQRTRELDPVVDVLLGVPLFRCLPFDELPKLAAVCAAKSFVKDEIIITEGAEGDNFYIIKEGQVVVEVGGKHVAILKNGSYIGEDALLFKRPRSATVRAFSNRVEALSISRADFERQQLADKLDFPKRNAFAAGAGDTLTQSKRKPPSKKLLQEEQLIYDALQNNPNIKSMFDLDHETCRRIAGVAWKKQVKKNTILIQQGDDNADYFYIVEDGEFHVDISTGQDVRRPLMRASVHTGQVSPVMLIGRGGSFGELALLHQAPRAATIKATKDSVVWVVDRVSFKQILWSSAEAETKERVEYLNTVAGFRKLTEDVKSKLARSLREVHFQRNKIIFEKGEGGDCCYILCEGTIDILNGTEYKKSWDVRRGRGDMPKIFGEGCFFDPGKKRSATVQVASEHIMCLMLDKETYDLVVAGAPSADDKDVAAYGDWPQQSTIRRTAAPASLRTHKEIRLQDLQVEGFLGAGGFASVELVTHQKTGKQYALKMVSKAHCVKHGLQRNVMQERDIMFRCNSSFIMKLYETYNGRDVLCFLVELATGGDLHQVYRRAGLSGLQDHARFYLACVVLAFEHLHSMKVAHRDLKPENLLLTGEGHAKLADFGLAKEIVGKTYTFCGTPEYLAPEIIKSAGHSCAVDWWTAGVLLFELMVGHTPFETNSPLEQYKLITAGMKNVVFPNSVTSSCKELIKGLCHTDPGERLPMKQRGIENVKKHAWFKHWDWGKMADLQIQPPHKPSALPPAKQRKKHWAEYVDDGSGWDCDFATSS